MVAAAVIGAAVVGGVATSVAGSKAASAQESAAASAANTQQSMYNQTAGNLSPYNSMGQAASNQLGAFYGLPGNKGPSASEMSAQLANFPGYQFTLQQGSQAIQRNDAAHGLLNSGATGKALETYGQGLAQSNAIQPYLSGLQGLSGLGENAAAMTGNAATQTGAGMANSELYAGNAAAGGYQNIATGVNTILYGLSQNYGGLSSNYQQYMANQNGANIAAQNYGGQADQLVNNNFQTTPIDFSGA